MKKKGLIVSLFCILLLYPILSLFQLNGAISSVNELDLVNDKLFSYQISIWVSWVIMVILAVYYKWTEKRNLIFTLTYGFLFVSFAIFGYYHQAVVNTFTIPTSFEDNYTLGVFTAVQNIVVSAILTGFLQAGVWWFTRRWHRS